VGGLKLRRRPYERSNERARAFEYGAGPHSEREKAGEGKKKSGTGKIMWIKTRTIASKPRYGGEKHNRARLPGGGEKGQEACSGKRNG